MPLTTKSLTFFITMLTNMYLNVIKIKNKCIFTCISEYFLQKMVLVVFIVQSQGHTK